tara:strand:+ start:131 stop:325 length:195 start_codon:yes stop_codon:yes gene_type:complete
MKKDVRYYKSNRMRTYLYYDDIFQIIIGFYDDFKSTIEYKHVWVNGIEIANKYFYNYNSVDLDK